jgi:hypothetical protein
VQTERVKARNWKTSQPARGDGEPKSASHAISYAKHFSRSHHVVIRVYDDAGNVVEAHEHKGNSKKHAPGQNLDDQITRNCRFSLQVYKFSNGSLVPSVVAAKA